MQKKINTDKNALKNSVSSQIIFIEIILLLNVNK